MDNVVFSILLVVVGLFVGAFIMVIINKFRINAAQKEADKLIREAKKEAEKAKRDGILELKEESYNYDYIICHNYTKKFPKIFKEKNKRFR